MKYRGLGKTGLEVSEIGFGAWAIGGDAYGPTSDKDSEEALERAWENGVNFYDTADSYGKGHSEELIARFLKGKPREKVFVATKAGWDFYQDPVRKRFDAEYLGFACERSLARLGTECVDLFQLHNPPLAFIESGGAADVLSSLKKAGKIRFGGLSVHRTEEARAAFRFPEIESLQIVFNVLDQRMSAVFEEAALKGVGLIAREPLASGLLTGKYGAGHEFPKGDHRRRWRPEKRVLDEQKLALIRDRIPGAEWPKTALEFVLAERSIASVIPGMKTAKQVDENLRASSQLEISSDQIQMLRGLFWDDAIFQQGLNPS